MSPPPPLPTQYPVSHFHKHTQTQRVKFYYLTQFTTGSTTNGQVIWTHRTSLTLHYIICRFKIHYVPEDLALFIKQIPVQKWTRFFAQTVFHSHYKKSRLCNIIYVEEDFVVHYNVAGNGNEKYFLDTQYFIHITWLFVGSTYYMSKKSCLQR